MAGLGRNITESISRSFTVGSLFRLAAQDIITADKAIYLDCDIIVRLDIRELWKIDIDGYCMAAVIDGNVRYKSAFSSWRVRCRLNGCDSYSYVNSGVVIMNLAEIRKRGDFFRISAEWLRKHIHNASCPDQDAYNSIFRGSIKIIDSRFNVISGTNPGGITENSVLHFAGAVKPWEISGHPSQTLYWKYYTHSAWGENSSREELIDAISSAKLVLRDIFYRLKYRLTRR